MKTSIFSRFKTAALGAVLTLPAMAFAGTTGTNTLPIDGPLEKMIEGLTKGTMPKLVGAGLLLAGGSAIFSHNELATKIGKPALVGGGVLAGYEPVITLLGSVI